ncbi:MAG: hypothetical protein WCT06_07700 [Armatimonadota bacterium]|jgi:outer membrane lipoprotein-sorting protein
MQKIRFAWMTSAALVFISSLAFAAPAEMAKSGYIRQTTTIINTNASLIQTTNIYWRGDCMRTEQYGVDGLVIQIKNGKTLYMYSPSRAQAVKTNLPANSQSVQQILKSMATPVAGGKKIGSSVVAGIKCDAYKVTKDKNSSAIVYQSTDPRFPLPLKTVITVGKAKQTTQTKSIKLNTTIASRMFTLPAGVKVKEAKIPSGSKPGAAAPNN